MDPKQVNASPHLSAKATSTSLSVGGSVSRKAQESASVLTFLPLLVDRGGATQYVRGTAPRDRRPARPCFDADPGRTLLPGFRISVPYAGRWQARISASFAPASSSQDGEPSSAVNQSLNGSPKPPFQAHQPDRPQSRCARVVPASRTILATRHAPCLRRRNRGGPKPKQEPSCRGRARHLPS